jgi:dTDP-4-amino-4,6-dideoxygalactose transaminase
LCIDASKIEKSVTEKTGAIIVVHEFGQSAEIDKILALADSLELEVIEDAACALGTEYNGLKAGTFGLMGCFSFHPRKAITTGEGGLIVTDDDDLACKLRALRNHGISLEDGHQDFLYAGLNYRMTEFQAVLGLSQLAMIEDSIVTRIRQAERYDKALIATDMIRTPPLFNNRRATYQTYHILADDNIDRNKLIASFKAAGIETNLGAQAINCLTYYRHKYGYAPDDFPNAAKAYQQGLALPIGNHLKDEDIDFIAETLIKLLKNI